MRCPKSRFPIRIIVFDELELIVLVSQGLTLSTASLVCTFLCIFTNRKKLLSTLETCLRYRLGISLYGTYQTPLPPTCTIPAKRREFAMFAFSTQRINLALAALTSFLLTTLAPTLGATRRLLLPRAVKHTDI